MIRMTHPLHGATHAASNSEVDWLKARGWSVETKETVHVQVPHDALPGDAAETVIPIRRGRPKKT